jgi:adenosylcobinamide-GDP ribazoletransferase
VGQPNLLWRLLGGLADLRAAFGFLSILPVGNTNIGRPAGYAFAYFPLVGLVIGAVVALLSQIRFLPVASTHFLMLLAWVALTGGLHLDGFADSCDGLLATTTPERRLEIMKDPRVGAWALAGVILLLLGKFSALPGLPALALLLPPLLGRWAMVLAVAAYASARPNGIGNYFKVGLGRPQIIMASALAGLILISVALMLGSAWVLILALAAPAVAIGFGNWASRRLGGGLTGDVYGAICEITELLCLLLLGLR